MHSALPGAGYDVKFVLLALFQTRFGLEHGSPLLPLELPPPLLVDPPPLLVDPPPLLVDPPPLLVDPPPLLVDPPPLLVDPPPLLPPEQLDELTVTLVAALKLALSVE
jgi:hypothetical protein